MNASDLIAFEAEVAQAFKEKKIKGPIHLSGGNEKDIIDIFRSVKPTDWVFSTYRNHYHALLHGIPREKVMAEIMAGRSMNLTFPEHRFFTSAIVGGTLPIAVGVAWTRKQDVWCFVGDMCARSGAFHEAWQYAVGFDLPITFVIENNDMSCDSPTEACWGKLGTRGSTDKMYGYSYRRTYPHSGTGDYVF